MPVKIISVGYDIPTNNTNYTRLDTKLSLLDYDIAIIDPYIRNIYDYYEEYNGKPCLPDTHSFRLKEHIEHWRREIFEAVKAGKTVFIMLNECEEVYVATGDKSHSGTGRSRTTVRHVTEFLNYSIVPGDLDLTNSNGSSMILNSGHNVLAAYWADLGVESEYRVLINNHDVSPLVITRSGKKIVGAIRRFKGASGALVFLPYIDFEDDSFTKKAKDTLEWNKKAYQVGARFIAAIVNVDKVIRSERDTTPEPAWVADSKYILPAEKSIGEKLLSIESKIEKIMKEKETLKLKLGKENLLKGLLYEKGKALEHAILEALNILGFDPKPYRDSDSEFDAVFESEEGRFLAEAEGKDNDQIKIEKMRQLETNISEDYERDEVDKMAKGVLMGNAYRMTEPNKRRDYFSVKCLSTAERNKTALIKTPDLFEIAKYLLVKNDTVFAKKCRKVIMATVGIVEFPEIPAKQTAKPEKSMEIKK